MIAISHLYKEFLSSSGIITDSRKAGDNLIFFALKGDNFDGNRFATRAVANGCRLSVIDDTGVIDDIPPDERKNYFLVKDGLSALQELARYHRNRLDTIIIGITGSNGKTTTKELIYAVLSQKYKTKATEGNLNNHIGVPLSILKLKNEEFGIIEMGANHIGEIGFLCNICKPDYGIITNIGKAHLEGFGSVEGIKKAKSELYHHLSKNKGTVFVNGSDHILMDLSDLPDLKRIYYISGHEALCEGKIQKSGRELLAEIRFHKEGVKEQVKIHLTGSYNLQNILAAVCIGSFFEVGYREIINGLESYNTSNNRSQFINSGQNQLVLDAYNANPTSMLESVHNFIAQKNENKVLILGDMLELGKYSAEEHDNILREIAKYPSLAVYLVGPEFFSFCSDYNYKFFRSTEDLYKFLKTNPLKNSYILLKGSRGITLEKLTELL